jgi:WD40 repeat protein
MARIRRNRCRVAGLALLAGLWLAPAAAEDKGANAGTDLFDHPVLAVDPGMHTGTVKAQAVDASGRFAVTGGADRTVRIWSVADGKLQRTIWIPAGPDRVGVIYTVAISPDGTTIAAGGWTERVSGGAAIYLFARESGALIRPIRDKVLRTNNFLTFSPDGRYLAAVSTLARSRGDLLVFDRDHDWAKVFADTYDASSYGASFAADGRLATTSDDAKIRLYRYDPNAASPNFRRVGEPVEASNGHDPERISFSPDGRRLAIGYYDVPAVDVLDGTTLARLGGQSPADATSLPGGLSDIAWSVDGGTLFAAGGVRDSRNRHLLLFAWGRGGLGDEQRMTYCAQETATGVNALRDGRIFVASLAPCLGLMDARGEPIWTVPSPILDFTGQRDAMKVSPDGKVVDFGDRGSAGALLRFDLRSLALSPAPPNDDTTSPPNREGLTIDGWRDGTRPTLAGVALSLKAYERARSLAVAPDAKGFFLGTDFGLTAFDNAGAQKWQRPTPDEVFAVNASQDGRVVVTAEGDGTIRWRRADDGRELLALQVLPNRTDWVLWTPEGYYEATPGAEDVLKWVTNHGPESAATALPVSALPRFHQPGALTRVLDEGETARALGLAKVDADRLAVQRATGSAKPPGGVLHVLAIGVDHFGDKAGGLHLDYAAEDAHDVATALLDSQKNAPGKPSLYADVTEEYLPNDQASRAAILDALDAIAQAMQKNPDKDVAVILVSSHGEMIGHQFFLIPFDFDAGSLNRATGSALSASDFAQKISAIAEHGRVLLLLDACHSGAVGAGGWASDPDARVLQDAMDLENVTVLASSKKNELSQELPAWKHGAFAQAFLTALGGAADPEGHGVIRLSALTDAMDAEIQRLTRGMKPQHLGLHVNFGGDLFVANH